MTENQKKRKAKNARLLKTYGITLKQWEKKQKEQEGKCWICLNVPKKFLCVDHRHVKGYKNFPLEEKKKEVRGGLCFQCNVMIGKLERRKTARFLLQRIVEYFTQYKMFGDD